MLFTAGSPPFAYKSVRITSLVVVNNFQSQLCKRFNCCPNVALLFATHATRCSNRRKTDQLKSCSLWRCCTAVQWEAIFTTKRRGRSADRSRVAVKSTATHTHTGIVKREPIGECRSGFCAACTAPWNSWNWTPFLTITPWSPGDSKREKKGFPMEGQVEPSFSLSLLFVSLLSVWRPPRRRMPTTIIKQRKKKFDCPCGH